MTDGELLSGLTPKERLVLIRILKERIYHTKRWSESHDIEHSLTDWIIILGHYLGKAAYTVAPYRENRADWKKRLIQLAAICFSALVAAED